MITETERQIIHNDTVLKLIASLTRMVEVAEALVRITENTGAETCTSVSIKHAKEVIALARERRNI